MYDKGVKLSRLSPALQGEFGFVLTCQVWKIDGIGK